MKWGSAATSPPEFIVDLMATSPVARTTVRLLRAGAIDISGDASAFRSLTPIDMSPRGVRKVRETFRFIAKPGRAAHVPSRPATFVKAATRGVRQSRSLIGTRRRPDSSRANCGDALRHGAIVRERGRPFV